MRFIIIIYLQSLITYTFYVYIFFANHEISLHHHSTKLCFRALQKQFVSWMYLNVKKWHVLVFENKNFMQLCMIMWVLWLMVWWFGIIVLIFLFKLQKSLLMHIRNMTFFMERKSTIWYKNIYIKFCFHYRALFIPITVVTDFVIIYSSIRNIQCTSIKIKIKLKNWIGQGFPLG